MNAFDLAAGRAWALSEDDLLTVMTIAGRAGEGPEAVALRLGRPLENTRTATIQNGVAVVPLEGPMFRRANLFTELSGATSTEQFAQDFQAALDNPAVSGVVLDISSPGGEAAGVNEVADAIFGARGAKPIVAYVGEMAASGAYWIASAADRIVVDATAALGSIGVVTRYVKNPDRPGVRVTEIVSSQSPNKRLDPESDAGKADIQRQVDAIAQVFVDAVARNRGVAASRVLEKFGRGSVEIGAKAVSLGMADQVGSLNSAIAELSRRAANAPASTPRRSNMTTTHTGAPAVIEPMSASQLAESHPEAAEALRTEGRRAAQAEAAPALATARNEAAAAERIRILEIHAATMPGYEAQARAAIESGQSAAEFALAQAKAEKARGSDHLAALRRDEESVAALRPATAPAAPPAVDPNLPIDEKAKAEWDADPKVRAEFAQKFGSYLAYRKAEDAGKIRRLARSA